MKKPEKWVFDKLNCRIVTEKDKHIMYTDRGSNLSDVFAQKIVDTHNSAIDLIDAIYLNLSPIEGTKGITQGDEVATGAYVREQYISEEIEELLIAIEP